MKIIVLTGQIGTGKSTISKEINKLGGAVVDTDVITHQLQKPGAPLYKKIVKHFGAGVVSENGEIDRRALGKIVFNDQEQLAVLNHLSHPMILKTMMFQVAKLYFGLIQSYGLPDGFRKVWFPKLIVLEIPLVFEAHIKTPFKIANVGISDTDEHRRRIVARDGQKGLDKLDKQMPLAEREARAAYKIRNDSFEDGQRAAKKLMDEAGGVWGKYLLLVMYFLIVAAVVKMVV